MFQVKLEVSQDQTTALVELPNMSAPQAFSAAELEAFTRDLGWIRSGMLPAIPAEDLKQGAPVSNVPAVRWQVTQDDVDGQCRLYLLHPGFGWLHIPLDQAAFDGIAKYARIFLRPNLPQQ